MKKKYYVIALSATTIIFVLGVLLGTQITTGHTINLQRGIERDLLEMQSLELELSLVTKINSTSLCTYIEYRLPEIIKKKVELGRRFDVGDIPDEDASLLRKQYVISLTKYWLFSEVYREQCNTNSPNIMFFFDNSEKSREQGRILDYAVYRSNESITVFAFNTQWDDPLIRLFMINYNVTTIPSVVLDEKTYGGLISRETVDGVICSNYNVTFC